MQDSPACPMSYGPAPSSRTTRSARRAVSASSAFGGGWVIPTRRGLVVYDCGWASELGPRIISWRSRDLLKAARPSQRASDSINRKITLE